MAHASLTLGRGHEIFGGIAALSLLQTMIVSGDKPADLTVLQSAPVEASEPTDTSARMTIGRTGDDQPLDVHGSIAALAIVQAWFLANPSLRRAN